jgi:hypothetical protein
MADVLSELGCSLACHVPNAITFDDLSSADAALSFVGFAERSVGVPGIADVSVTAPPPSARFPPSMPNPAPLGGLPDLMAIGAAIGAGLDADASTPSGADGVRCGGDMSAGADGVGGWVESEPRLSVNACLATAGASDRDICEIEVVASCANSSGATPCSFSINASGTKLPG